MESNLECQLRVVASEEELQAVYRFWYRICVEEMGRYQAVADHARKHLVGGGAGGGIILGGFRSDGTVVGTLRMRTGADIPFSGEYEAVYDLQRFYDLISPEQMCVVDRFMLLPAYRDTLLPLSLFFETVTCALARGCVVAFCDCEPHLLNLYYWLGMRNHAPGFFRPDFGYMLPLMLISGDAEHHWAVGSPLLAHVSWPRASTELGRALAGRAGAGSAVLSEALAGDGDARWERVVSLCRRFHTGEVSLFAGLSDAEIRQCLSRSHVIQCRRGDRLVSRGGAFNRTLFLVLAGAVEVHRPDRSAIRMTAGALFGEVGFLMHSARTADIVVATDDAQILALSEGTLRPLLQAGSRLSSRLLYNLALILCGRLMEPAEPG